MKSVLTAGVLENLHEWLAACAEHGRPCPGNREIARRYGFASGATAAKAIARLEKQGRIRVHRGWTARQATILATGRSTAPVPDTSRRDRRVRPRARPSRAVLGPRIPGPKGRQCQWIEGEPSGDDDCKCLRRTPPGSSWCPAHRGRIHLPPELAETRFGSLPGAGGRQKSGRVAG